MTIQYEKMIVLLFNQLFMFRLQTAKILYIGYIKLQKKLRAGNTTCPQFVEKVCF